MSYLQILALACLGAALGFVLRALRSPLAAFVGLVGGLALLFFLLPRLGEPLAALAALCEAGGLQDTLSAVLRMLGVGFLTAFAAEICRDLGESTLATRVELCGKIEILLLSLPALTDLFSLVGEVAL